MLLSTKDQGLGRRRPRSYSHNNIYTFPKHAQSSRLSLLSAVTAHSSHSNGSNSTVTQESYNKSRNDVSKKKAPKKQKKGTEKGAVPTMEAVQETSEGESQTDKLDVFAFLVDDEVAVDDEENPAPIPTHAVETSYTQGNHVEDPFVATVSPSDSGISMDDGNALTEKAVLKPLPAGYLKGLTSDPVEKNNAPLPRFNWTWPVIPKASHMQDFTASSPANDVQSTFVSSTAGQHDTSAYLKHSSASTPPLTTKTETRLAGANEVLALVDEDASPAPFRSFYSMNFRVLRQLQEDIDDLEKEFSHLDALLKESSQKIGNEILDHNRRPSWHQNQYQIGLQGAKADLINRLDAKLEQYYMVLSRMKCMRALTQESTASDTDINQCRQWLEKRFASIESSDESSSDRNMFSSTWRTIDAIEHLTAVQHPSTNRSVDTKTGYNTVALCGAAFCLGCFVVLYFQAH